MRSIILFVGLIALVNADLYLHNMRGSNNRLAETTATRTNGNRLFDSQNNARGGYNVGDKTTTGGTTNNADPDGMVGAPPTPQQTFQSGSGASQYPMVYLEGSIVAVEWTSQHGCGGNEQTDVNQLNCNMVMQYTCDTDTSVVTDKGMQVYLRDGITTNTPTAPNRATTPGITAINNALTTNNQQLVGRHESEAAYYECEVRYRNTDLFLADQDLTNKNYAIYTRQNPNGGQRGLECPEERDYYPYWGPTIWRDVMYMTDRLDICYSEISPLSQNVAYKGKCTDPTGNYNMAAIMQTNKAACESGNAGGRWQNFTWGLPAPECLAAPWSRVNHLGNGRFGAADTYNWTLPMIDTLKSTGVRTYNGDTLARCVMRMRYNITTDDYDPWTTNRKYNDPSQVDIPEDSTSPITGDPTVDIGVQYIDYDNQDVTDPDQVIVGLRLAIDTTQFGRTFQDRSHVFYIVRQGGVANLTNSNSKIWNLNVRGKRGNIVQVYPAVEYDFAPNYLFVTPDDLIHIQWTGSNTHNNNGDGGDGQTGDAGQGADGTDRQNFAFMGNLEDNFPLPLDREPAMTMWNSVDCYNLDGTSLSQIDCQVRISTAGYFWDEASAIASSSTSAFSPVLDNAPPSLRAGIIMKFKSDAVGSTYNYMCTRNNSFTNRSQKGTLVIEASS